ncbi:MAG: DNA ligase D [Phycisphaerales bacterium]
MSLKTYKQKRDFKKTAEPSGAPVSPAHQQAGGRFVVQLHDASHLHYDFRLELEGVLKSWAVPKGPPLEPGIKRLAVHVEDHPLEYGNFEGTIPKGQYGGGTVMVWDTGTWVPLDEHPGRSLKKGRLSFRLSGQKLKGEWTLTRMSAKPGEENKNWLLIRKGPANPKSAVHAKSVLTGRSLEQIAGTETPAKTDAAKPAKASAAKPSRTATALPRNLSPQLCTLTTSTPPGDQWIHEVKYDGYRLLVEKSGDDIRLLTRTGLDWAAKFPTLAAAARELPCRTAIVDGEATMLNSAGRPDFQLLQSAIKARSFSSFAFFAFDLLYLNGSDLRKQPLLDRKAALESLLTKLPKRSPIRFSEHFTGGGAEVFRNACGLGLEGVVSKQADAPYISGRTRSWLKIKCTRRQEFIIVGYTRPGAGRSHFGALLLAAHANDSRLTYCGKVGTGFSEASLASLAARMKKLIRSKSPLDASPPAADVAGATWIEPKLVAEIAFTEWTQDHRLRHPSFQGLREDKPAAQVKLEHEQPLQSLVAKSPAPRRESPKRSKAASSRPAADATSASIVSGIPISHPERQVFPELGVTKLEVAEYYRDIAPLMLPHLVRRPLSVLRCVQGIADACFFQKHLGETFGPPVLSIPVRESKGTGQYLAIDSVEGLVTLIQMGVLEIHPWGSTQDTLEKPDLIVFDLDPGPGVTWKAVKTGALDVKAALEARGLSTFLKTSGGKGLHVVAPLRPKSDWDEVKAFTKLVATQLAEEHPDRYTAIMSKSRRQGKIFIDYLRNGRGATSVAPYSVRARAAGGVSMPLDWKDLARLRSADQFTIDNARQHLARRRSDPWARFRAAASTLP